MRSPARRLCRLAITCGLVSGACDTLAVEQGAADPGAAQFQPGEISIGEPLQLPARRAADPEAVPLPSANLPPFAATSPPPRGPGNGWIGLTVDEKVVTGRLVVTDIAPAGPAERAGIQLQDQLLAIDGTPLRSADQLAAALAALAPGSTVKVAIGRGDRIDEIAIRAAARPAKPAAPDWQKADTGASPTPTPPTKPETFAAPPPPPALAPALAAPAPVPDPVPSAPAAAAVRGRTALGVRTLPVDESVAARFNLAEPAGALVIGVVHDLPASKAGVPPGSVIVALDNQPVRSPNELTQIVTRGPIGRPVTLQYILPGGEQRRAEVSLQSLEVPLERALVGPEP